ncbi:hypothetical protein AVEN_201026-1 [Araneus ventricosus]|uniref:Uncharacterized protein n=1 Tax=Araneus ventricosus TaxID=182803 RepID=A0A4Y2L2R2_ARAVE|nr:hypothetical protein AVEN_201026-1 [Araneus ventricosus]
MIGRMLAHGSSAWCLNPTEKMKRKLSSIQRSFHLSMSGAYCTTPTAALQAILGLPPLYLLFQYEARLTTLYRLQLPIPPNIYNHQVYSHKTCRGRQQVGPHILLFSCIPLKSR